MAGVYKGQTGKIIKNMPNEVLILTNSNIEVLVSKMNVVNLEQAPI